MKKRTWFVFMYFLTLGAVFGQPVSSDSDNGEGLIFPLDGGEECIGVYGLMKASEEELPTRTLLNQRVNDFIETGAMHGGELQVVDTDGGMREVRLPLRAELMYLRLLDVEADLHFWFNHACLDHVLSEVVAESLTYDLICTLQDQLNEFYRILQEDDPFVSFRASGLFAVNGDFTEIEYSKMHRYFLGYVYFVENVLRPWRAAMEGTDGADVLFDGGLWRQDLRSTIGFRFYVFDQMDPSETVQATRRSFEEAGRRLSAIDQGPLEALIAFVIMNRQLNGMHGLWRELRDALEADGPIGNYNRVAQDFVLRHLEILNALLLPEELLPMGWPRQNQAAINRGVLSLHLKLRDLMVQLFAYAKGGSFNAEDWDSIMAACEDVWRYTRRCFGYVEPLAIEDPDSDGYELGEWEEDVIMEGRGYGGEQLWATYGQLMDGDDEDSVYSDDEGEIDYPDEDEGNRGYYDDDAMDNYYGDTVNLREGVPEEEDRFQVFGITGEDLNAAIRGVFQPFSG